MTPRLHPLLALAVCISAAGSAIAQDPVFSQYTANPVYNNPGLAGLFEGEVRLSTSYREQWRSVLGSQAFRTFGAAAEVRHGVGGRDFLVGTFNAYRDESGAARYTQSGAGVGIGMQKYLSGGRGRNADYLGFGARVGFGQNAIDDSDLWFTSNLDTNTLIIGREGFQRPIPGKAYFDLSAGLNYAVVRRHFSFTAGIAGHHLNWPNHSLLFQVDRRLKPRISGLLAAEILLRDHLRIMPSTLVEVQGTSTRVSAGAGLRYSTGQRGDRGFRFGTYLRVANQATTGAGLEAIVVATQVELNRVTVGLSYDINTGAIGRTVDARGAYEVSMSWTRAKRSRYRVVCPKL